MSKTLKTALCVLGLVLVATGLIMLKNNSDFVAESIEVSAKVKNIETNMEANGEKSYAVKVEYKYDGEKYEVYIKTDDISDIFMGEEIKLYINSNDYHNATIASEINDIPIMIVMAGACSIIVFLLFTMMEIKQNSKINKLKNSGVEKQAVITGAVKEMEYMKKGVHPYKLNCEYKDEISDQPVICTSTRVWEKPETYIGKTVLVYVDENNRADYYVDLSTISR